MIHYRHPETGEVFAYETVEERDIYGAPQLVEMTPEEVDDHLNPVPTLEDAQAAKVAEINAWKDAERESFEWGGHTWDSDGDGRTNIMGVIIAGIAPPSGYWTSADNVDVPITTVEDMQAMYSAMVAKAGAVHDRQRAMKLEVEDMTDVQAILDYPVGW